MVEPHPMAGSRARNMIQLKVGQPVSRLCQSTISGSATCAQRHGSQAAGHLRRLEERWRRGHNASVILIQLM